jgi:hypothetical protein
MLLFFKKFSGRSLIMKTIKRGGISSRKLNSILARTFIVAGFLFCSNASPAQGITPPPDPNFQLNTWSFDDTSWYSDLGYAPLSFTNLNNPPSFDGNAVQVDSTNAASLQYNIVESDGTTNLTFNQGTIEVWVLPDWNSGTGSGNWGRLIDVGAYSTNTPSSWWSLYFSPDGSSLYFSSETNGVFTNYLNYPISWDTNTWHFVALTYNRFRSQLYVDGQLATNGAGAFYLPSANVVSNGFFVGSDNTGMAQSRSLIDDLATYNYALSADDITNDYAAGLQIMGGGSHGDIEGPPGSGGSTNTYSPDGSGYTPPDYGSNLWLEITNVSNGMAYVNLHHATDEVYEVWSKIDLMLTNWNIEQEVWPTNSTVMPFIVSQSNRTNLFIWARDWTGVTNNGNTTPDWWFWEYFGTTNLLDTNLDNVDNTLLDDYQVGLDPNVIQFSLQFTNTDLNTTNAYGVITIHSGVPSYVAVLVNNTNEAGAVWQPYSSSNVVVSLGSTNGLYNVLVGLRGLPSVAQSSWVQAQLTLNTVTPIFTITNPTASTVSVPMIQLQGLVSKSLSKLTFDVSNATGIFTNLQGYWQPMFYDTNLLEFTTNSFQCYDILLTNGLNRITLHATDVVGNTATTNVSYTLDYSGDTNPPVLSLVWPTNGTSIAGSNFTLQAQVDDATTTVTTTINSNAVAGLVERSGAVWFNNLPLNSGTNTVTITATDAAGNMSTTNLNVVQSAVSLTINPISSGQLNRTNVTVSGTIGDSSEKVRVNGVFATVSGTNWTATNVLVNPDGTASLNVQVSDSGNNLLAAQNIYQPQPVNVVLENYKSLFHENYSYTQFFDGTWHSSTIETIDNTIYWSFGSGGARHYDDDEHDFEDPPEIANVNYPAGESGFSTTWEYAATEENFRAYYYPFNDTWNDHNQIQTHVMIDPQGQVSGGGTKLYLVRAKALELPDPATSNTNDSPLPPEWLQINGQTLINSGITNTDGAVWGMTLVSAPAGVSVDVTPTATQLYGYNDYTFTNQATNVTFQIIDTNSGTDLTLQTNTVIVGQQMSWYCQLSITNSYMTNFTLTNFQWTVPGFAISNFVADGSSGIVYTNFSTTSSNINFYWVDGASNRVVQCSAMVNGKPVTGQAIFNVLRPMGQITATTGTVTLDTNYVVGIDNNFSPIYGFALHYGSPYPYGTPGIIFSNSTTTPSGFSGNTEWIQEITSTLRREQLNDGSGAWYRLQTTNVLDTSYPYPDTIAVNVSEDSPGKILNSSIMAVSVSDNFDRWLMFKPTGGKWVPLRKVSWNWGGAASLSGTNWTETNWVLTSSNNSVNPTDTDSTNYPQWNSNITNSTFQPE